MYISSLIRIHFFCWVRFIIFVEMELLFLVFSLNPNLNFSSHIMVHPILFFEWIYFVSGFYLWQTRSCVMLLLSYTPFFQYSLSRRVVKNWPQHNSLWRWRGDLDMKTIPIWETSDLTNNEQGHLTVSTPGGRRHQWPPSLQYHVVRPGKNGGYQTTGTSNKIGGHINLLSIYIFSQSPPTTSKPSLQLRDQFFQEFPATERMENLPWLLCTPTQYSRENIVATLLNNNLVSCP